MGKTVKIGCGGKEFCKKVRENGSPIRSAWSFRQENRNYLREKLATGLMDQKRYGPSISSLRFRATNTSARDQKSLPHRVPVCQSFLKSATIRTIRGLIIVRLRKFCYALLASALAC
jgi:hypothetical protein